MPVTVRKATRADAVAIANFAMLLSEQHREYDNFRFVSLPDLEGSRTYYGSRAEADDAAILIAELNSEAIGFAYLEYEARNYADLLENAVWLHDIHVAENSRDTGAGRKLIEAAKEAAKDLGADKFMLHVAARNANGEEFFKHAGFETTMLEMMLNLTA